eukprot:173187_1
MAADTSDEPNEFDSKSIVTATGADTSDSTTSDHHNNNNNCCSSEASAVEEWLLSSGLSVESCTKLLSNGYNSMGIFTVCNEDDIDAISDEFNLSLIEKLKLKSGINKLLQVKTDRLQIIDPLERNAMI